MRRILKQYFDKIRNEKIKEMLLQAFPFWTASLVTGIIAVGYAKLFALAEQSAVRLFHFSHVLIFITAPVCFVLSAWVVQAFAPLARGSGIPQVMAGIEMATPKENALVDRLLNMRIIVTKVISSCVMAVGGAVIGREGPTIQIAGAVFRKINNLLPAWWVRISKRNMIMTGAAAGLAAAFNTPLGGVVFAMEELAKNHIKFYRTAIFSAVIIAGITAQAISGPYLYIGYPQLAATHFWIFLPILIVAILCGAFAAILCKGILRIMRWKKKLQPWKQWSYVVACGLAIAAIAYFTGFQNVQSGKEAITGTLFTSEKYLPWYAPLLRMTGSLFSFTSGGAGGVFAPALSAGASTGSVFAHLFSLDAVNSNVLILSGMVAFLTGITRSPFTSAILVLEMTDGHNGIFYFLLAALVAGMSAYFIDRHSFYDRLMHTYMHELRTEERHRSAEVVS